MKMSSLFGFISLAAIKFTSLLLMAYVLFFLFFFGGLSQVGIYSAITAVTAPLAMFCSFRYVEWIALHENKSYGFSLSVSAASVIYMLLAIPSFFVMQLFVDDWRLLFLLFIYKLIEMICEFYMALLASRGEVYASAISVCARFILVAVLSLTGVALGFEDGLWIIIGALLISYAIVFIFLDMPRLMKENDFIICDIASLFSYVVSNFRYGLLGAAVSVNSVLPRYFFTYLGDMKVLGLFSLVYQVAATVVNVAQYPVSIGASHIKAYFQENYRFFRFSIVAVAVFALAILSVCTLPSLNQHNWIGGKFYNYLVLALCAGAMFIFLMYRGILFSVAIASGGAKHLQWLVLVAGGFALLTMSVVWYLSLVSSSFLIGCLYVSFSSFFSALLVFREIKLSEAVE